MYEVEDSFWWYVGMRNNLVNLLERYWDWNAQPQPRILDAGCGTGAALQRLADGFGGRITSQKALGLDLSAEALRFCRERGLGPQTLRGSITELPFADHTFDILLSFDVISNLPEPTPGFREFARVLRHGGIMVLNLPAYQFLYSEHDMAVRTLRRFSKGQVRNLLAEHGLMPLRMSYVNSILFPPAAVVRLTKKALLKAKPTQNLHSDLTPPPPLLNKLLLWMMAKEADLLRHSNFDLPFGLSLITVARKM
jgi:SAM-dependent methyltransferase